MRDNFQANLNVVRLYDQNNLPPEVTKVGILPFAVVPGSKKWEFMVMKPREEAKHLGAPMFQLAKGTRRIHINDRWCDMREDDLRYADTSFFEPAADTALREGHEEIGLKQSNIKRMFDMGNFVFTSASKGVEKPLRMFAAEIIDRNDFDPHESSTSEVRWITQDEFEALGRPDHARTLIEIAARLKNSSRSGGRIMPGR